MSIRLRLTLLYSVILAVTLIAFSALLYVTQSRITFDAITETLARQAQQFVIRDRHLPRRADGSLPPTSLPGRWTQLRSPDGAVTARTGDLGDLALPLSDAGLHAVQDGKPWIETARVQDEPLLIYSLPIFVQDRITGIVQVATSIAEREQSLNTLRLILIVGSGLVIAAAFVIGWFLSGMVLRPIHRITQTAQTIGADRDFARRVQHTGPNDEIGQLAVTFNNMLTELESAYRQVEQALHAQRRFVADASHELRTPLTTIRGNIDLLRNELPMDGKERQEVLADTKEEAERLIRLVNQLLVLARADARRPLHSEPVLVRPLIEDAVRQAKLLAPNRTITYDASTEAAALGDRDALKQVLLILLDNALVHTPSDAAVGLSAALDGGRVVIRVRDSGAGIAPDLMPHIFERFFRGDASRSGGGAGLGLSIAKELTQAQHGTLEVESRIGNGSTFILTLPQAVESPS